MTRYIQIMVLLPVLMLASFFFHELAHWSAGQVLGYDMMMTLNRATNVGAEVQVSRFDQMIITAAGPVFTIMAGLVGYVLTRPNGVFGLSLVYVSFFMRATAYLISVFMNPNDEANVGLVLGIGIHPLHLLSTGLLFVLTLLAARKAAIGWPFWLVGFLFCSSSVSAIVLFIDPMIGRIL